jgi:hypothetical protein
MRWLVLLHGILLVGTGCTRMNPAYGDGGGEGDGTGQSADDGDPSGPDDGGPSDASASDGTADGADDEATDSDPTDATLEGPVDLPSCCERHSEPGCANDDVEACVCELHPDCCAVEWDETCVEKARVDCDAGCPGVLDEGGTDESTSAVSDSISASDGDASGSSDATSSGTGTVSKSPCCDVIEGALCQDTDVADCVCAIEGFEFCCAKEWTEPCATAAVESCPACQ